MRYRVNSKQATDFRIWATNTLKEYIKKGWIAQKWFQIWKRLTDIFAECSIDYDKDSDTTQQFHATVQNKFNYAITGNTAAEIEY